MIYTYSINDDTKNAAVAFEKLKNEIEASSISVSLDYVGSSGDSLNIAFTAEISPSEKTNLDAVVSVHDGVPIPEEVTPQEVIIDSSPPFASKKIKDAQGNEKSLFKRVHGVSASVADGATVDIDFTVPYAAAKFTGAEIFNTDFGDTLDFTVHDDATNTYSGAPTTSPGYPNYILNQFGFDVQMPNDRYKNTSNYDADLYLGMIVRCSYTNNSGATKSVSMNVWIHEVKD
jgi:hypothetical protein